MLSFIYAKDKLKQSELKAAVFFCNLLLQCANGGGWTQTNDLATMRQMFYHRADFSYT